MNRNQDESTLVAISASPVYKESNETHTIHELFSNSPRQLKHCRSET